jgi:hypothetical protein
MMDCKKLREILDLYVDHELAADAIAQANVHIAECGACRRAVDDLRRLREAIRVAVGKPEPSPELFERVRSLILPRWYQAAAARAIAAMLVLAGLLALLAPSVRGEVATALDYLSRRFDSSPRQVVWEGTLLCRDQQLARQYGYRPMCRITGHHGWLVTSDGRYWSILEGDVSRDLIHNSSLLGRRVKVEGRIFRKVGSIEVSSYELL